MNILKWIFQNKTCKVHVNVKPVSLQKVPLCNIIRRQDRMRVQMYILFGTSIVGFIIHRM